MYILVSIPTASTGEFVGGRAGTCSILDSGMIILLLDKVAHARLFFDIQPSDLVGEKGKELGGERGDGPAEVPGKVQPQKTKKGSQPKNQAL